MSDPISSLFQRHPDLASCRPDVEAAVEMLRACFAGGGKLLVCGNGGSAADAEHVVGELMKGYAGARPLPAEVRARMEAAGADGLRLAGKLHGALPTIALSSQTALTTAIANDMDPTLVFAQQVVGYGRPGDALLALSTSGRSANVLEALRVARMLGLRTIGLSGAEGGEMRPLCDVLVGVPSTETATVQEQHLPIYHAVCHALERTLFPR